MVHRLCHAFTVVRPIDQSGSTDSNEPVRHIGVKRTLVGGRHVFDLGDLVGWQFGRDVLTESFVEVLALLETQAGADAEDGVVLAVAGGEPHFVGDPHPVLHPSFPLLELDVPKPHEEHVFVG